MYWLNFAMSKLIFPISFKYRNFVFIFFNCKRCLTFVLLDLVKKDKMFTFCFFRKHLKWILQGNTCFHFIFCLNLLGKSGKIVILMHVQGQMLEWKVRIRGVYNFKFLILFLLHYNYWGKLFVNNSLILDKVM